MNKDLEKRLKNIEIEKRLAMDNLFYAVRGGWSADHVKTCADYHRTLADEYGVLYKEMHDKILERRNKK